MRVPERLGPYLYRQSDTCFPLGQDSLLLAAFATLRRRDRVWDLGCGAGALLLLLAAREGELALTGVERNQADGMLARDNLAENGLKGTILTGDIRTLSLPAGAASLVVCNPPYFPAGSGASGGPARMEEACLTDWCAAAGRLLNNGGRFALVHRPERLAELFAQLTACGIQPKRLQLVQHRADIPPSAALVEGVRQGKPGLQVLPVNIIDRRN
ncbi:tRNA1(Val) (adenine(37)-N6)-methyltransferase [uncultured Flavonifractor sp.]|uniref:tRNA1(Val) (adenine(37)-N6)-methyltransferase n=1 Tax=uncultured Flavonifractor sp. TaxID=1193534 RepID=UPI00260CD136|nr:methyltransferase [uncultured Flavonifractor sp.]